MMDLAIRDDLEIIQKTVSETDKVLLLAEEAAELSAAASKYARILKGTNPTPMSGMTAQDHMFEEIGDILVCLLALKYVATDTLTVLLDYHVAEYTDLKTRRWARRIEEKMQKENEK